MDLFLDGSLLTFLKNGAAKNVNTISSWINKVNYCLQVASGLMHLHNRSVVHADIALR
jgi:hypothetical protein